MKLLTQKIIQALPKFHSQDGVPLNEQIVICKFFTPDSNWTWFVFEGEPINNGQDYEFFGMVHGHEKEMGYFHLSELKSCRGPLGLPIERDKWVFKQPYKQIVQY